MKIHGIKYQAPCTVIVGKSNEVEDEELQFGHVIGVLVSSNKVLFEFELMQVEYIEHLHAYALSLPPTSLRQKYLIEQSNLISYHPYGLYHCHNLCKNYSVQYTVLKSNIYI